MDADALDGAGRHPSSAEALVAKNREGGPRYVTLSCGVHQKSDATVADVCHLLSSKISPSYSSSSWHHRGRISHHTHHIIIIIYYVTN